MSLLQPDVRAQILDVFTALDQPVKLLFFRQRDGCPTCPDQQRLLEEVSSLSPKVSMTVYDIVLHGDESRNYGITRAPATVIMGERDYGIRFYGVTAGHEFSSLISTMILVSSGAEVNQELAGLITSIDKPVNLKVLTTLTCPYCPTMVQYAHLMAYLNPNIVAEAIDVSEYPDLTRKYNVTGVPKTFINEANPLEGVVSLPQFFMEVLRTVEPERYRLFEETLRKSLGQRNVSPIEEDHLYDIIVVGGGPAGIGAALYAARKGVDVALVSETFGGQLTYTAKIDNYLGLGGIDGTTMIEVFRNQLEQYPIAQEVGKKVASIQKKGDTFEIEGEDFTYNSRTVILTTGMEYTRLGVPGEEQLIGKGIGFCATCDAPLFRDRKVAVVGGGNSAFTAVRDLLNYASEITLIHRREEFTADKVLQDEILGNPKLQLMLSSNVSRFHGEETLTGVTVETGGSSVELGVDGVFIEIGLSPNSECVLGVVDVNENKEVLIDIDGRTSVEGLFAAGDVTQVEEKQISIAVGQGTVAALSAYKHLYEPSRE